MLVGGVLAKVAKQVGFNEMVAFCVLQFLLEAKVYVCCTISYGDTLAYQLHIV